MLHVKYCILRISIIDVLFVATKINVFLKYEIFIFIFLKYLSKDKYLIIFRMRTPFDYEKRSLFDAFERHKNQQKKAMQKGFEK
jgi:hypothetical protein